MKVLDKKIGDTTYYKYRVNLPKEIVEKGDFLEKPVKIMLQGKKIVIQKE